jgi:hypothetical protein
MKVSTLSVASVSILALGLRRFGEAMFRKAWRHLLGLMLGSTTLLAAPVEAGATDCPVSPTRNKTATGLCSGIAILQRSTPDAQPNAGTHAVYAKFERPGTAAERLYNDWIEDRVGRLNFQPVGDVRGQSTHQIELLSLETLYRSKGILSARYRHYWCCGPHGDAEYPAINVDMTRGRVVDPGSLLHMHAVATACSRQLAEQKKMGFDLIDNAFTEEDLRPNQRAGLFLERLVASERWSFSDNGAVLELGNLHGYANGPYICRFTNAVLRTMARPGVAIPP